jgi:hypothetical protein
LLDSIVSINPYLSAPYLEITDKGAGVYEIVILMHVQQPTGDTHNVENEFDSSTGTSTQQDWPDDREEKFLSKLEAKPYKSESND